MTHDDSYSDYARQEQARMKLAAELRVATKAKLFDVLQSAGIACVAAAFDGEGDSGQIDDASAFSTANKPMKLPRLRLTIQTAKHDGSGADEKDASRRRGHRTSLLRAARGPPRRLGDQ